MLFCIGSKVAFSKLVLYLKILKKQRLHINNKLSLFPGDEVPVNEQINTVDKGRTAELLLEQEQIQQNNEAAANSSKISDAERQNFEEERGKLYKQIDERVGI